MHIAEMPAVRGLATGNVLKCGARPNGIKAAFTVVKHGHAGRPKVLVVVRVMRMHNVM